MMHVKIFKIFVISNFYGILLPIFSLFPSMQTKLIWYNMVQDNDRWDGFVIDSGDFYQEKSMAFSQARINACS